MGEKTLEILTGESFKSYKKKKTDTESFKTTDEYTQRKRFHYDLRLRVYMYASMYVHPDTM